MLGVLWDSHLQSLQYMMAVPDTSEVTRAGGGEVAELQAKIVNALKNKGPMPLSQLGGLIKRPAGAPKLKKILEDNAAVFKIDGSLNVSLA